MSVEWLGVVVVVLLLLLLVSVQEKSQSGREQECADFRFRLLSGKLALCSHFVKHAWAVEPT